MKVYFSYHYQKLDKLFDFKLGTQFEISICNNIIMVLSILVQCTFLITTLVRKFNIYE